MPCGSRVDGCVQRQRECVREGGRHIGRAAALPVAQAVNELHLALDLLVGAKLVRSIWTRFGAACTLRASSGPPRFDEDATGSRETGRVPYFRELTTHGGPRGFERHSSSFRSVPLPRSGSVVRRLTRAADARGYPVNETRQTGNDYVGFGSRTAMYYMYLLFSRDERVERRDARCDTAHFGLRVRLRESRLTSRRDDGPRGSNAVNSQVST